VPSLHFAVAPVGSVLLAVAVGADLLAVADLAAVLDADGAAVVAAVAGLGFEAFCIPPWPLQVPLPVEVLVVPSLQVVVVAAVSAARPGSVNAKTNRGAAMRPATVIFFMNVHSLV
jgi:hypothetical protein